MLVIRKCLFGSGSSKGVGDEKHKYYDIPSFPNEDFPLIFIDPLGLHAPPEEAHLQPISEAENGEDQSEIESHTEETLAEEEEPPSHETIVEEPQQPEETLVEEPELQDLSSLFWLREPDCSSLYTCTEILGSEICDNMVKDMREAVTEWSWSHKRQKQKAVDVEMLANRGLPPPIPRYMGRPCQFMNIERSNGRIRMSLVQMDRQPEVMEIEREDGQVKMQLMTYIEYAAARKDDAEASTSTSTSQEVVEKTTCDEEEELELVTDMLDTGGKPKPQKKCLALAA